MACEELLTNCTYALLAGFGALITALVAVVKSHNNTKEIEELKK